MPNRLGILRAPTYLVFCLHNYLIFESGFEDFKLQFVRKSHPIGVLSSRPSVLSVVVVS
jgi:hypothetical protein